MPSTKAGAVAVRRRYYLKNREKVKAWTKANSEIYKQRNREYVRGIKATTPCGDCGVIFHPAAMDFHHVRGTKHRNLAQMVGCGSSIEAIDKEIAKCELICSNCHRVRHHG